MEKAIMRKMIFSMPENLVLQVDAILESDGFVNRPDFFRFLARHYLSARNSGEFRKRTSD